MSWPTQAQQGTSGKTGTPPSLFPLTGNQYCEGRFNLGPYFDTMTRHYDGPKGAIAFMASINEAVAGYMALVWRARTGKQSEIDTTGITTFAKSLTEAARRGAFTRVSFSGKGISNPTYWQAALLINVSYFVNLMDQVRLWAPDQRQDVIAWGNALFDASHRVSGPGSGRRIPSVRWGDHVAIDAAAYISWGVVTGNQTVLRDGLGDFETLHARLRGDGLIAAFIKGPWNNALGAKWNLRLQDNMLGYLVLAAHAAKQVGIDLYSKRRNGATLHDAVHWHVRAIARPASVNYVPPNGQNMEFLKSNGHAAHWGWTEVYLRDFPDEKASAELKELSHKYAIPYGYSTITMGKTTCLFRAG